MATSVDASLRHDSEDSSEEDENVFIDVETYSEEDEDEEDEEDEDEEDDEDDHQDTKRNSAMLDRRQVLPARDRALKHCENCRNHGKQQLVSGHFNCAHAACACDKCVKSRWKRERARQRVQSYRRSIAAAAKEQDVISSPTNASAPLLSSADMESEVVSAASISSTPASAAAPEKPRSAAVKAKRVRSYKRKHPDTDDDKVREKVADILKAAASANVEEPTARLAKSQQKKSSSHRIRHECSEKTVGLEVEEAAQIDDGYEERSASVDPLHDEIDVVTVDTCCEQASRMIAQIAGSFDVGAGSHRQPYSSAEEMVGSGGLASTRHPTFGEFSTSMPTPFSQLLDECSKRVGEMPSSIDVNDSSCASNQCNDVMTDDSAAASTSWAPGNTRAADGNVEHTQPFGAARRVRASQKEQRLVLSTVLPLPSASRDVYLAAADLSRDYERLYCAAAAADSAAWPSSMAELRKRWPTYVARLERNRRVNDYDDGECPSERLRLGPDASPTCVILAELLLQRRAPDDVRALLVSQATRRAAAATHAATRATAAPRAGSRAQRKQTNKRPKASVAVTACDVAEMCKSEAAVGGQNHNQIHEQLVAFLEKQQRKQQIDTISPLPGHCWNDYGVLHSNQSIRDAMLSPITSSQQSLPHIRLT